MFSPTYWKEKTCVIYSVIEQTAYLTVDTDFVEILTIYYFLHLSPV